ncbi:unnamed protein product, partial [Mesorhabditis belari]|uniref:Uncharacterized protein n=1 Tax=Mesorhabditis belari TaxID=2138241 RepID=A0AAF3EKK5_9BILA
MADWIWRPKVDESNGIPGNEPNVDDYRVFPCVRFQADYANSPCCRLNAYTLFKCVSTLLAAFWVLSSIGIVITMISTGHSAKKIMKDSPLFAIEQALCLGVAIVSFAAIFTKKPAYAQMLFPAYIVLDLCLIGGQIYSIVEVVQHENFKRNNVVESGLFACILGLVLIVVMAIWTFAILYVFYTYLRDKHLHWERTHPEEAAARLLEAQRSRIRVCGVRVK